MSDLNACPDCGNSEMWEPTERAGNFCETWRCRKCQQPVPEGDELEARRWLGYHLASSGNAGLVSGGAAARSVSFNPLS